MTMKKVRIEDAVGMVLGHDMTKIVPGEYKGPAFRKGHVIREEDLPHLRNIGKEHIYLIELAAGQVHENDAVRRMAQAVAGENVTCDSASEGRVSLTATVAGLLKVNRAAVNEINSVEYAVLSTRHGNQLVRAGDLLAGIKVVPLVVNDSTVSAVEAVGARQSDILSVRPLQKMKVGVIVTGNEVFYGRIQDRFAPVFAGKIADYGATPAGTVFQPDEREKITQAIFDYQEQGAEVIIVTGGMSVDPDDVTPDAIRASGAEIITYGSPVLPGAMFMLGYLGNVAILGIPACGMYAKITVFDLVFPRILAGERITRSEISAMGYGGLCLNCSTCTYPHCSFGK